MTFVGVINNEEKKKREKYFAENKLLFQPVAFRVLGKGQFTGL